MIISARTQRIVFFGILLLGLLLRLKGINNPIIDHPGWRQGDEAAIARNFAFVDLNPLHPQADYNGPGPNYVELELQIVPFLAGLLYKIFGVHEVFGRLISIVASLGTIAILYRFGNWLFRSQLAGPMAALLYAVAPGAIYYGRTFQPDAVMAFFLTCALYAGSRTLLENENTSWRGIAGATGLLLAALLAKSVALLALLPLAALMIRRFGLGAALRRPQHWVLFAGAILPLAAYDRYENSIASWHWASGITRQHVIPSLLHSFTVPSAFFEKLTFTSTGLLMLAHTMLGPVLFTLLILGFLTPLRSRSATLLVSWLAADLLYTYVVVSVERVDYYLYPFLPLAALVGGAYIATALEGTHWFELSRQKQYVAGAMFGIAFLLTIVEARAEISPYYEYSPHVLHQARMLDAALPPDALIVMAHLDPGVLYYIHRRGWQEDPFLWTPFDEQSAIRKGARYFVVVEPARLARNIELAAWLTRFPLLPTPPHVWNVYVTDPMQELPDAEKTWRHFRNMERMHKPHSLPGTPTDESPLTTGDAPLQ